MRIMGIDYGTRRIGIAIGDSESGIASPWRIVENESMEDAVLRIIALAKEEGAEEFVVGVPLAPDGSAVSETGDEVVEFIRLLEEAGAKIHRENELLSSKVASAQMQERGEKRKRDDLAAAAILQTYLDRLVNIESRK
jgi:putative Holliday junction resolvase